jgi:hypothetical protein
MQITFKKRNLFGKTFLDPVDQGAHDLMDLVRKWDTRRKALKIEDLDDFEKFGVTVNVLENEE